MSETSHGIGRHALADFNRFLSLPAPPNPAADVFCHNDLGEDHILLDPQTGALAGVIDFSDALLGDPARDFALILLDLGRECAQAAVAAYGGDEALMRRAAWYAVLAGLSGLPGRAVAGEDLRPHLDRIRRVLARPVATSGSGDHDGCPAR